MNYENMKIVEMDASKRVFAFSFLCKLSTATKLFKKNIEIKITKNPFDQYGTYGEWPTGSISGSKFILTFSLLYYCFNLLIFITVIIHF